MVTRAHGTFGRFARSRASATHLICGLHIASNGGTMAVACKMQVTKKGKSFMSHSAVLLHPTRCTPSPNTSLRWSVVVVLALWFALAFSLGARGVFITPRGTPPLALLAAVLVPIGFFLLAYLTSRSLHDFVLTSVLPLLT